MRAAATNDPRAIGELTQKFAPSGGEVLQFPDGDISYPSHGEILCLTGHPADRVRGLGPLTRIGSITTGGQSRSASTLPMPLIIGDKVDEVQIQLGYRHANEGGIVTNFDF